MPDEITIVGPLLCTDLRGLVDIVDKTSKNEFTELFPPLSGANEGTVLSFER